MRKRISFSLESTLGDSVSSNFHGIFGLNCYEYTFWQLIRQAGIADNFASLHTKVFLTGTADGKRFNIEHSILQNMRTLEKNIWDIHGLQKVSNYQCDNYKFIEEAINKGRFVYLLYNNYYDNHNYRSATIEKNEYHSTIITGLDDTKKYYIPLIEGTYNIYFEDYEMMSTVLKKESNHFAPWGLFYLRNDKNPVILSEEELLKAFIEDLFHDMDDWLKEIKMFQEFLNVLEKNLIGIHRKIYQEDEKFLWEKSCLLQNIKIGISGNFVLKLKALNKLSGVDFDDVIDSFYLNRKTVSRLGILLGRIAVDFDLKKLEQVLEQLSKNLIEESSQIRETVYNTILTMKEKLL